MKFKIPTFLVAYPSDINGYIKNIAIIDENLTLLAREKYFLKKDFGQYKFTTFAISDSCQILYFLDEENQFWIFDIKSERIEKIKCVRKDFIAPKDIAIRKNVLYVIDENSLMAISLTTWQTLWVTSLKDFLPKSLTVDKFYIYVLGENKVLKFDFAGRLKATPEGFENPVSIFAKDNIFYVLKASSIWKNKEAINLPSEVLSPISFSINSKGNIYIGSDRENKLWGVNGEGEIIDTVIIPQKVCKKILFDHKDNLWILNREGYLSLIVPERIYEQEGEIIHIFDSTIPQCEWHRLKIDGDIPKDTSLQIDIAIKENINENASFISLPSNQKNAFLPEKKGRYLEVKISFKSDPKGELTPVLRSIKVIFPKETYLQYLPAIYQEEKESKDILERYLSIFQDIFEEIESYIENTHLLIDPQTTRGEFLNWLSSWLGLVREERWSDEKWRKFLGRAIEFFKMRGTREGLSSLIELFTEEKPIIIEPFQLECSKEKPLSLSKFSFCVLLKPKQVKNEEEFEAVKRIIFLYKPAHTEGKTVLLKENMLLGDLLYLGINTYLKPREFILGKAVLPIETKLSDIEENAQIERHSRLGIDTKINF